MTLLVVVIALALVFDYINGFHDAANSIATIVSTKVLTPLQAVIWAAAFNFIAYFIFSDHHVANTVAKTVHEEFITLRVVLAGLLAAITWNLLTWWYGIPSSSSHTLIGGFAGAALAGANFDLGSIDLGKIGIIALFIFLAPLIGMVISVFITLVTLVQRLWFRLLLIGLAAGLTSAFVLKNDGLRIALIVFALIFMAAYAWDMTRAPSALRTANLYKRMQLLSSAAFSIGHGGNDAQKVMGIIMVALVASGQKASLDDMPAWVPLACYTAIGLGTLSGGWKIVKTMGSRITKVTPLEGVCAESAGAMTLYMTEQLGIPVSTTHTITGAIIGVGVTKRVSAVRWGVTLQLLWAWILTIPVSAVLAAIAYWLCGFFGI
ncbi:MAG: inorganic phosphate transporter [Flavobacteriales bacterium]|jgi:PiT family inorganic phosphate transporter|nr:inorganic phosphate transporter [Flavobacteriales bacterium]MBP6643584.1 inorganic phosphate transporter [Flavobacteriales bacterium]MBP7156320.1 inorganic phosphate transporter [Flavobacteriales bacterium]HQV75657.1 inorganic phosphate transporter [Flavobacteriales bacterium]HQW41679.1 inorganic phosphate transporter [Flavobacteriales bacterium]